MDKKGKAYFERYEVRDGEYLSYEKLFERPEAKKYVREKIKTVLEFKGKGNLLDIGCGFGYYLKEASKSFNPFGIDVSEYAIGKARKTVNCPEENLVVGSAESLPFEENFFDVVIAIHSIEHVKGYRKALKECSRVLKKDGILFLEFPSRLFEFPHCIPATKRSVFKINRLLRKIGLGHKLQFVFDKTHLSNPFPWTVARGNYLKPYFKPIRILPEEKRKQYYSAGFSIVARPLK